MSETVSQLGIESQDASCVKKGPSKGSTGVVEGVTNGVNRHEGDALMDVKVLVEKLDSSPEKADQLPSAESGKGGTETTTPPPQPESSLNSAVDAEEEQEGAKVRALLSNTERMRSLCKRGDAEELDRFLSSINVRGDVDLNVSTDDGWTCLHDIITHECQFTEVARILLRHGADLNTSDASGDTPLHSSLLYHNTDNIVLLLENHAELEAVNSTGRRPIHIANDGESLRLLLDHGASVDAQDRIGNTPLHYAVLAKDRERVDILLGSGCDVQTPNGSGASPLHLANDFAIAQALLSAQADPNCVDNAGNSPLHLAVRGRHKEVARLLLKNKADQCLANNNGKSPFNLSKDKEMKRILLGKEPMTTPPAKTVKNKKTPVTIPLLKEKMSSSFILPVIRSPSILKRKKLSEDRQPTGRRLRFSEVNDYSGVEDCDPTPSKRVKVAPVYTDPQLSSDED